MKKRPSTHPSTILKEEFLIPLNLSLNKIAKDTKINIKILNDFNNKKEEITQPIATKLSKYFGTTPQFWLNLQENYNREKK